MQPSHREAQGYQVPHFPQGDNMRRALSVLAFSFLVACGDKDEDTGSEDTAADSTDTAVE